MQGMRAGCMRGTHALSQLSPTVPEATYLSGDGASSVLESLSEAGWTLHRAAAQHNALMTLVKETAKLALHAIPESHNLLGTFCFSF